MKLLHVMEIMDIPSEMLNRIFDAVYLNSVMWMITQDENYAKKSLELMLAYAEVLKDIEWK